MSQAQAPNYTDMYENLKSVLVYGNCHNPEELKAMIRLVLDMAPNDVERARIRSFLGFKVVRKKYRDLFEGL